MLCFVIINMFMCVVSIYIRLVRTYAMYTTYTMNPANVMIIRKIRKTYLINPFGKYFSLCSSFFHTFFLLYAFHHFWFGLAKYGGGGQRQDTRTNLQPPPETNYKCRLVM
jgi:hypothetical protein